MEFSIEKVGSWIGAIGGFVMLGGIALRFIRRPWEKPIEEATTALNKRIDILEKKIGDDQNSNDRRITKVEFENQSILQAIIEIKSLIQKRADDDRSSFDRLNEKIDNMLFQLAKERS